MAKKKTEEAPPEKEDPAARLLGQFRKEMGEGVAVAGCDLLDDNRVVIPFSPAFDLGLGGGIPEGCVVTIAGGEKLGKTSSALSFCANAQRPEYGSRQIIYGNIECRFQARNLRGIEGLDPGRFTMLTSSKDRIVYAHDYLSMFERVLQDIPGCVLLIDSTSMLCDETEATNTIGQTVVGGNNRLFASFMRRMAPVIMVNRPIVICINHLYTNIGGMGNGPKWAEKGAKAMFYQADVRLRCTHTTPWKVGDRQIGQEVHWKVVTSALGGPGAEFSSFLRYGVGVDRVYEASRIGQDLGLIGKAGSWLTLDYLRDRPDLCPEDPPRFQGGEKVYQALRDNPAWLEALRTRLATFFAGSD
jgi:RecA/RadA recombinase